LHAQIAKALESSSRDIVENEPEILAHHYTSAGLEKEAIQYWEKAGQKAGSRSASVEAVKSFNRAITLLSSIDDGFERKRRELNLQQAVGTALVTANAEVGRDC
jgi:predicted ATPase